MPLTDKEYEDEWTDEDEAAWQALQARRVNLVTQHRNRIWNMVSGFSKDESFKDELTAWLVLNARQMTEALKPFVK